MREKMAPVPTQVTVRQAHKDGSAPGEYDQAWIVRETGTGESLRVAVADGATEDFLAGNWASLLTSVFMEAAPAAVSEAEAFAQVTADAAGRWPGEVDDYVSSREAAGNPLQWYEQPGLDRGAYATLLVLDIEPGGSWRTAAVGDTCLFQVRESRLMRAFPLAGAKAFGDIPPLLGSSDTDPAVAGPLAGLARGTAAPGDGMFVCTSALAAWFLAEAERGARPWEVLDTLNDAFFQVWLEDAREMGQIRDDDVTLISLEFG